MSETELYDSIIDDLRSLNAHIELAYVDSYKRVRLAIFSNTQLEHCNTTFMGIYDLGKIDDKCNLLEGDFVDLKSLIKRSYKKNNEILTYIFAKRISDNCQPYKFSVEEITKIQGFLDYRFVQENAICKKIYNVLQMSFEGYKYENVYDKILNIYKNRLDFFCVGEIIQGSYLKFRFYAKCLTNCVYGRQGSICEIDSVVPCTRHIFKHSRLNAGDYFDIKSFSNVLEYTTRNGICKLTNCYCDAEKLIDSNNNDLKIIKQYKQQKIQNTEQKLLKDYNFDIEEFLKIIRSQILTSNKPSMNGITCDYVKEFKINFTEDIYHTYYEYRYRNRKLLIRYENNIFNNISYVINKEIYFALKDIFTKLGYSAEFQLEDIDNHNQNKSIWIDKQDFKIGDLKIQLEHSWVESDFFTQTECHDYRINFENKNLL